MGNVTQNNGMVGNGSDLFIGYPMQMFYGYKTDGVFPVSYTHLRLALVFHGEQGPLCIYPGRDDHLQGA